MKTTWVPLDLAAYYFDIDVWGGWKLDTETLVLIHPEHGYDVDLEGCTTSAGTLDAICQVAGKRWADAETLSGLVQAIDSVVHPQSFLCSFGQSKTLDPALLQRRIKVFAEAHPECVA